ncbi:MAG: HEAT repeat domain-containing protein [Chitinivibrionales bacterium]|nr:HEAT repeat domain-containing protein [Chitinivibrionales bacterium]
MVSQIIHKGVIGIIILVFALCALGNDSTHIKRCIEILKNPQEFPSGSRALAAFELGGRYKVQSAVPDLINAFLKDSSAEVRSAAAKALGIIGTKQSVNALKEGLKDKDLGVQLNASLELVNLKKNKSDEVVGILSKIARGENEDSWDVFSSTGVAVERRSSEARTNIIRSWRRNALEGLKSLGILTLDGRKIYDIIKELTK